MDLYHHVLLDHYRHSPYRGEIEHPCFTSKQLNPSCGDAVAIQGMVDQGIITTIRFTGSGCVISQAAASLLSQAIAGKSITYVAHLEKDFMLSLLGIQLGPTRARCALLALDALKQGIQCLIEQSSSKN